MAKDPFFGSVPRAAKRRSFSLIRETGKNRGLKREAELILLYYVPPRTAVTLDTSMGTEAEAIQSSPRFFLVSFLAYVNFRLLS
jgi:hypothetical protein